MFLMHKTTRLHELDDDLAFRTEHLRALGDERLLVDLLVAQRENVQGQAQFSGGGLELVQLEVTVLALVGLDEELCVVVDRAQVEKLDDDRGRRSVDCRSEEE